MVVFPFRTAYHGTDFIFRIELFSDRVVNPTGTDYEARGAAAPEGNLPGHRAAAFSRPSVTFDEFRRLKVDPGLSDSLTPNQPPISVSPPACARSYGLRGARRRGTRGQPPGASCSSIFTHIDSLGGTLLMGSRESLLPPRGCRARNYSAASNPFALIPVIQARYSQGVVVQGGAHEQHQS